MQGEYIFFCTKRQWLSIETLRQVKNGTYQFVVPQKFLELTICRVTDGFIDTVLGICNYNCVNFLSNNSGILGHSQGNCVSFSWCISIFIAHQPPLLRSFLSCVLDKRKTSKHLYKTSTSTGDPSSVHKLPRVLILFCILPTIKDFVWEVQYSC